MVGLLVSLIEFTLNTFYRKRPYPRFYVLESINRIPYFAFTSVLQFYETMGWWRKVDWLRVHGAQSWHKLHHLLIIEELGGAKHWPDRLIARLGAFVYYWLFLIFFMVSSGYAYHFAQLLEEHAYHTYASFLEKHQKELKSQAPPQIARNFYAEEGLFNFEQFQTGYTSTAKHPQTETLYDIFLAMREDTMEHIKILRACQEPEARASFSSPYSSNNQGLSAKQKDTIAEITPSIVKDNQEKDLVEVE